jgi:hypothetical protein
MSKAVPCAGARQDRLGKTRARAKEAHQNLVWWRAGDFLRNRKVCDAIGAGRTDPADGHRLAVCSMTRRGA